MVSGFTRKSLAAKKRKRHKEKVLLTENLCEKKKHYVYKMLMPALQLTGLNILDQ
jgi:hypothetical protein